MSSQLDQVCSGFIITIIVIVLMLAYSEMCKMKVRTDYNTCGMKSNLSTETNANNAVSAKRTTMTDTKAQKRENTYMTIEESWPTETVKTTYKEAEQDEESLLKQFGTWEADEEATMKHIKASPNADKARLSANTRAITAETMGEKPKYTKKLGLPGLRESAGLGKEASKITFSDQCPYFLGSDSYVSARESQNMSCGL